MAAVNAHVADQAAQLIEVDYEVLPTVLTLHDALDDNAPIIHDKMTTHFRVARFARGEDTGVKGNIAGHIQHKLGDVEKGFAEADVIVEREFETETVHQGYIEPHASTADLVARGPADHLDLHPEFLRVPRRHSRHPGPAGIGGQGHTNGDRRRVRRQAHLLPGAGGRGPVPARAAGR